MLSDPQQRFVISSLGWVDRGSLWIYEVGNSDVRSARIGDARYLSLRSGRSGYFAVVHHYESGRLEITAHSFEAPDRVLSRAIISGDSRRIEGAFEPWSHLPRHYVAQLKQPAWSDSALVSIDAVDGVTLQTFEWYDRSYDKLYQGIIGVTEVPESDCVLVSVQRSSMVVIYSTRDRRKVGEIVLGNRGGSPELCFSRNGDVLWAGDYDTIVKVSPDGWRVIGDRKLQPAAAGSAQFIGKYCFDADERLCAVARPFSGDVIAIDPESLQTTHHAKVGAQPLEVALLRNGTVLARDWKSGSLLRGALG